MSDTTEAMRAALAAAHGAIEGLLAWDKRRNFPVPYKVRDPLHAALKHPTPAAPAVTDSTHTGAGLGHAAGCTSHQSAHAKCDCGYEGSALRGTALDVDHRMRQPSPERNDCEPVAWKVPEPAYFDMPDARPAGRRKSEGERRSPARFAAYTVGMLHEAHAAGRRAPPPPAERHYCERCGKRLGSTLGVHTCTPPGYEVKKAIRESARNDAIDAYIDARPKMSDEVKSRKLLEDGFDRGWDAATKEPQQ